MMTVIPMIILVLVVSQQVFTEFDNVKKLAQANNELAFKLHKSSISQGNVIISPISIFSALAMLYQGARGITAEEMREVLSFSVSGLNDKNINQQFQELLSFLGNSSGEYKLEIANAILFLLQYPVMKEYNDTLEKYYNATLKEVNIAGENSNAFEEINNWVRNKTEGKIKILSKSMPSDTVLALMNSIYFKGTWKTPFRRHAMKQVFYNDGVDEVSVKIMAIQNTFFCGNFSKYGFEAVKMPYKGDDISMLFLLPFDRKGLRKMEQGLTSSKFDDIISKMKKKKIKVNIPKFKLKGREQLKGMKSAFTGQMNFAGISREGNLEVSKIVHRVVVEVNEKGTEAAGVIAKLARYGKSRGRPNSRNFYVNHPFLFFIIDDRTGMILFYGRVNKL